MVFISVLERAFGEVFYEFVSGFYAEETEDELWENRFYDVDSINYMREEEDDTDRAELRHTLETVCTHRILVRCISY